MNADRIYNRRTKGLDNGVWLLMIILMILSLGLLSFMWMNNKKCLPFAIKITRNTDTVLYTGNTIYFDITVPPKNLSWDYGDGANSENEMTGFHIYPKAGKYLVTATNSGCDESLEINILTNPHEDNSGANIEGPVTAIVGKDVDFTCLQYAKDYKWEVDNYSNIRVTQSGKHGEKARFRFTENGVYKIRVKLDDNRINSYTKEVTVTGGVQKVKPAEEIKKIPGLPPIVKEKPEEKEKQVIGIAESGFRDLLRNVLEDDSRVSADDFNDYLSLGIDGTKVMVNGHTTKFRTMFTRISGQHGTMTVDNVEFIREEDNTKVILIIKVKISNY